MGQQPRQSQSGNAEKSRATIPPRNAPASSRETIPPGQRDSVPVTSATSGQLGPEFGRYTIEECLGQGAMGTVYRAHDRQLDRMVALKIPKFTIEDGPELMDRFYTEARSAATLSHPHICPMYDVGEIDGTHYISMGYIDGRPLSAFINPERPQKIRQTVGLLRKLAMALQEAHSNGVVHRDLKPDNVMVDKRSNPVIMDFGLARRSNVNDSSRVTQGGQMLGTPAYMSPEQVDGALEKIGPACDIYALGVVTYEMLTGRLPYEGSIAAVLAKIINGNPQPPSQLRADIDNRIESICLKMMASDIGDRYTSMSEVVKDLTAYLKEGPAQNTDVVDVEVISEDDPTAFNPWAIDDADVDEASVRQTRPGARRTRRSPSKAKRKSSKRTSSKRRMGPKWLPIAAGAGASLIVLLTIMFFFKAGDQTIKIEIDDPDAQIFVDGDEVTIKNLGADIQLKPGKHDFEIRRGDIVVKTDSFKVLDGDNQVLKISVLETKPEVTEHPAVALPDGSPTTKTDVVPQDTVPQTVIPKTTPNIVPRPSPQPIVSNPSPVRPNPRPVRPSNQVGPKNAPRPESIPPSLTRNERFADQDSQKAFVKWAVELGGHVYGHTITGKRFSASDPNNIEFPEELFAAGTLQFKETSKLTDENLSELSRIRTLQEVTISGVPVSDVLFQHLRSHIDLRSLSLEGVEITDDGLKGLSAHPRITEFRIARLKITDDGIRNLSQHSAFISAGLRLCPNITDFGIEAFVTAQPGLMDLRIEHLGISDAGMASIGKLANLSLLAVSSEPNITDAGVKHLAGLEYLRSVRLEDCAITDESLKTIASLANLGSLSLIHLKGVTDAGIKHLETHPQVDVLTLSHNSLTDEVFKSFGAMKKLRMLSVSDPNLTGEGMIHLQSCTSLKRVYVAKNEASAQDVDKLKALLPKCSVQVTSYQPWVSISGLTATSSASTKPAAQSPTSDQELTLAQKTAFVRWVVERRGYVNTRQRTPTGTRGTLIRSIDDVPPGDYEIHEVGFSNSGIPLPANDFAKIMEIDTLEQLSIARAENITDDMLQDIPKLTKLTNLDLQNSHLTDNCVQYLAKLPRLRQLSIHSDKFTGATLGQLSGRKFFAMNFLCPELTDIALERLSGIRSDGLMLISPRLTDKGMEHISNMTGLQSLTLSCPLVTDEGMRNVAKLKMLYRLDASHVAMTDRGLSYFADHKELRYLVLTRTQISDAGLEHVKGFEKLQHLSLGNCDVSEAAVERLQKVLPKCRITGVGGR